MGSPPRMRGKPKRLLVDSFGDRITPADAGKTPFTLTSIIRSQDHPRGCGENTSLVGTRRNALGSPPRMRGKRRYTTGVPERHRITPADAGKTRSARPSPTL